MEKFRIGRKTQLECHSVSELAMDASKVGQTLGKSYDKEFGDNYRGRRMGLILHPTSLPGPYGCGEIGGECYRLIDWISNSGMQCWQTLPLVPPDQMYYSPYTGLDANCGNPLLISLEELVNDGLLTYDELPHHLPAGKADFVSASEIKAPLLARAADRVLSDDRFIALRQGMEAFRREKPWVEDSALFDCLRTDEHEDFKGKVWWEWPEAYRSREASTIRNAKEDYKQQIDQFITCQYLFDKQWKAIKAGEPYRAK